VGLKYYLIFVENKNIIIMKTVIETNECISEFMGIEIHRFSKSQQYYENGYNIGEELEYNTSWIWLMPVIDKIEKLGYGVTIGMGEYCVIQNDWEEDLDEITSMSSNGKLLCTYNAVLQFIEWYNKKQNDCQPCTRCNDEMRIIDYENGDRYSDDGKMPCPDCQE
jgi:hypothetical protein